MHHTIDAWQSQGIHLEAHIISVKTNGINLDIAYGLIKFP